LCGHCHERKRCKRAAKEPGDHRLNSSRAIVLWAA
jgi:hypothetical protein